METVKGVKEFLKNVRTDRNTESCSNLEIAQEKELSEDEKNTQKLIAKDKETDIDLKKTYGETILSILIGWLVFVGFVLLLHLGPVMFRFSDEIIAILLTTTTANIIALPTIILKYLFPKSKK